MKSKLAAILRGIAGKIEPEADDERDPGEVRCPRCGQPAFELTAISDAGRRWACEGCNIEWSESE